MSKFISIVQMIDSKSTSTQDQPPAGWQGRSRAAWYVAAVLSLVITIVAIPGYIQAVPEGFHVIPFAANPSPAVLAINTISALFSIANVLLSICLAFLLFRKQPKDRMAVFLSFYLLAFGILTGPLEFLGRFVANSFTSFVWNVNVILFQAVLFTASCFLFVLFPDGRFASDWSRYVATASLVASPVMVIGFLNWSRSDSHPLAAQVTGSILPVVIMIGVLYALFYRYRYLASGQQRQQIKWVVYGLGVMLFIQVVTAFPYYWSFTLPEGTLYPIWLALLNALYFISFTALPVSLTIAVMHSRLYDIDILINRTMVYGTMTTCIIGMYVVIVGAASAALQASNRFTGFLLATVLVVVLFQPLRAILQRGIDRLMSKKGKDTPPSEVVKPSESARVHIIYTGPVPLTKPWLRIARLGWYPIAAIALGILIASIPAYLRILENGLTANLNDSPSSFLNSALTIAYVVLSFSAALISVALAWVLYKKKPSERMAVFLSFYLLAFGIWFPGPLYLLASIWSGVATKIFLVLAGLIGPPTIFLFVTFPDGKFVPPWTRWLVLGSIPIFPLFYISGASWQVWVLGFVLFLFTLYAQFYRFRKVSNFIERQQTKWVIYGFSLWFLILLLSNLFYTGMQTLPPGSFTTQWMPASGLIWVITTTIFPVSLAIAVMRYRLYDIDIIINRTLVYGVLTVSTMGIYVLGVGLVGNSFQEQDNTIIAFLTTGVVALLFQPLRERLQSAVNHMMYGERSDPVSVLSKLGKQLEETPSPSKALDGMVTTVAQTLKLPYVAIEFGNGAEAQVVASSGQKPTQTVQFPIGYQGQNIGNMLVAPRSPGESFGDKDNLLLENVAHQAGAAAQAVKLTADLQRSRQGLVTAREEERRRLRRDLHDGIGPTMAGQTLKLDAAIDLILGDPESGQEADLEEAVKMLLDVKEQTQKTVKNIRQIVYALRPPSLDDLGLVDAIRVHIGQLSVSRHGLDISMQASPQDLTRLSAAVEVAAYRIVLEALTNVINHAQAQHCVVKISIQRDENGVLHMEIIDDGIGLPKVVPAGVGLTSMRERVEELGGSFTIESNQNHGTRILAQIPLFSMET